MKKLQLAAFALVFAVLLVEPWPARLPVLDVGGPAEAYAPCNVLAANAVYWTGEYEYWKAIVDEGWPYPSGALAQYGNALAAMQDAIADYM